jgi:LmbE family N-acetylglucosaminyl deacetylase
MNRIFIESFRRLRTLIGIIGLTLACSSCGSDHPVVPLGTVKVLLITAHPDDETMFSLGRFRERGWQVSIALVTNGENGQVVQGIRPDYNPDTDSDILIEKEPGPGAWLTVPPDGPLVKEILTHPDLARQRRQEFLASCGRYGVTTIFFLSDPDRADFEDSWDNGVSNWNQTLLADRLSNAVWQSRPDLIITLNPDETWAHPQHFGLARIVRDLWQAGSFDLPGSSRPSLYGIREHGWWQKSWQDQTGDLRFDRSVFSTVLGMTYEAYWRTATGFYQSQSSHPIWFDARVGVNILPGYRGVDIIRRLDTLPNRDGLDQLFVRYSPDPIRAALLPTTPVIVDVSGG